jgi:hypothetical protein
MDEVVSLYPDNPSAGSPYGTGNETFGTGPGFKRGAAICTSSFALWHFEDPHLLRIDVVAR